jgi:hypothetical protein
MSNGVSNGSKVASHVLWGPGGWTSQTLVSLSPPPPEPCNTLAYSKTVVTKDGLVYICPRSASTPKAHAVYWPDGSVQPIRFVPYSNDPNGAPYYSTRYAMVDGFGLVAFGSEFGDPPASLEDDLWYSMGNEAGEQFLGNCYASDGVMACTDGTRIMFTNNVTVTLPPTAEQVVGFHVWPSGPGVFTADRTTANGKTERFAVETNGALQHLEGNFASITLIAYAGELDGHWVVFCTTIDGRNAMYVDTLNERPMDFLEQLHSTVGATKGPLDGHVSVKAFETKFICRN